LSINVEGRRKGSEGANRGGAGGLGFCGGGAGKLGMNMKYDFEIWTGVFGCLLGVESRREGAFQV